MNRHESHPRSTECTAQLPNGRFCGSPAREDAPFPMCERHLRAAYRFWRQVEQMESEGRDNMRALMLDHIRSTLGTVDAEAVARRERQAAAQRAQSVVYYVRERDGAIKIGFTANLHKRLSDLRLPPEAVLATEPGDRGLERLRHQQFAHLRLGRLERFTPADDLDSHIAMLLDHFGPPTVTTYVKCN
jgi:hypothetical protein